MKTITFRGKRTDNGEWVYGYYFKDMAEGRTYHVIGETPLLAHEIDPGTVGQFTGLHDMAGVGIFEDDIIELTLGRLGYVMYHEDLAQYVLTRTGLAHTSLFYIHNEHNKEILIIGNIHDNPEILSTK